MPKLRYIEHNGEKKLLSHLAKEYGVHPSTLSKRIEEGMPLEEALSKEKRTVRIIEFNGEAKSMNAWAKSLGIDSSTLRNRFSNGWSLEEALTTPNMDLSGSRLRREAHAKRKGSISAAHKRRNPAKAALRLIQHQFPNNAYGLLWFSVLQGAVLELYDRNQELRENAREWLMGDMDNIQMAGIDPDYVRRILKQFQVEL